MKSTTRSDDLRRYRSFKSGSSKPSGRDHQWGIRFERSYPLMCPKCQCFTRSPFDKADIIHDVDACLERVTR